MDPQPLPPVLSYPMAYAYDRDADHLRLISIFHYVYGGLIALGCCFFLIYLVLGIMFVVTPPSPASGKPPPPELAWVFIGLGTFLPLLGWTLGGLIVYSGRCIAGRRSRTFSLVMAGIMCATGLLGIALAVFTFIVLLRPAVKLAYGLPP